MDIGRIKRLLNYIREGKFYLIYEFLVMKIFGRFHSKAYGKRKAIKVMEEDWDYLIVLDACRYDFFKELVDKETDYVISGGTNTQEWLEWNFRGRFKDVIYIAGNPHFASAHLVKSLGFNPFFKVEEVWDYGWDESVKTVHPKEVTKAALNMLNKFPDKRMIVHYNQPHRPYFTNERLLEADGGTCHTLEGGLWEGVKAHKDGGAFGLVRRKEVSIEELREAYGNNLRIVMEEVNKLQKNLTGRVIVTADHGDHLGEYHIFGHLRGLRTKVLVKVPWYVLKDDGTEGSKTVKRRMIHRKFEAEKERVRGSIASLKKSGKL